MKRTFEEIVEDSKDSIRQNYKQIAFLKRACMPLKKQIVDNLEFLNIYNVIKNAEKDTIYIFPTEGFSNLLTLSKNLTNDTEIFRNIQNLLKSTGTSFVYASGIDHETYSPDINHHSDYIINFGYEIIKNMDNNEIDYNQMDNKIKDSEEDDSKKNNSDKTNTYNNGITMYVMDSINMIHNIKLNGEKICYHYKDNKHYFENSSDFDIKYTIKNTAYYEEDLECLEFVGNISKNEFYYKLTTDKDREGEIICVYRETNFIMLLPNKK